MGKHVKQHVKHFHIIHTVDVKKMCETNVLYHTEFIRKALLRKTA